MSKSSPIARSKAFIEWHEWAKKQHPSYRAKKKKVKSPKFVSYGKNDN